VTDLIAEKIDQASQIVAASDLDAWLVFVRETGDGGDPVLPFILEGSLTWLSALIFFKDGRRTAIVGTYDGDALDHSGHWHQVLRYDNDIKPILLQALPANPKIGLNFSLSDEKCDGLTHGMYLLPKEMLTDANLVSAEKICMTLRGQKTPSEVARMRAAIQAGDQIFHEIASFAKIGVSERAVFNHVHSCINQAGLGFAWSPPNDPIVNSGPNSMSGHGIPSDQIVLEPGHVFHIDLGVTKDGYSSDIQRCWFVGDSIPADVQHGFVAVRNAILAGFAELRPGVPGWKVDAAARASITAAGYEEYKHALGHQVGRVAHDGGALLGPRWERYGDRPFVPIAENEIYTLELGVNLPNRGYLGLEEMVQITPTGATYLSTPQTELGLVN
jgi:Xaa-Pro aminopeptidase